MPRGTRIWATMNAPIAVWLEGDSAPEFARALAASGREIGAIGAQRSSSLHGLGDMASVPHFTDPRTMAREAPTLAALVAGPAKRETIVAFSECGTPGRLVACHHVPLLGRLPLDTWAAIERVPGFSRSAEVGWMAENVEELGPARQVQCTAWWPGPAASLSTILDDTLEAVVRVMGEPSRVSARASVSLEGVDEARTFLRDGQGSLSILLEGATGITATVSISNAAGGVLREIRAHGADWTAAAGPGWTALLGEGVATVRAVETPESALEQQLRRLGSADQPALALAPALLASVCCATAHSLATDEPCYVAEAARMVPQDV